MMLRPVSRKPGRLTRAIAAAAATCALVVAPSTAVLASQEAGTHEVQELAPEATIELMIQAEDGSWIPTDEFTAQVPQVDGEVAPYLVNPWQWAQCNILGNESYVLHTLHYRGIDGWYPADLTCGTSNGGYKHIKERHEVDWQRVWDNAKATGWDPNSYAMDSWDDLMWWSLNMAVTTDGMAYNTISNKACNNVAAGLVDASNGQLLYTFRAEGVISMNNARVISAYPSSRTRCNP